MIALRPLPTGPAGAILWGFSFLSREIERGIDIVAGEAAGKHRDQTRYSSIVLDLGLPDEDGMSILQELRGKKDPVPVLILTARFAASDRVKGLRSGADDYLVKPFAFEELVARLEAILRRPSNLVGSSLAPGRGGGQCKNIVSRSGT